MDDLESAEGFDWEDGNRNKYWISRKVTATECEMVFFNRPLVVIEDEKHSAFESRVYAFGKTDLDRPLIVAFCLRKKRIRVISARDMDKKERIFYESR